MSGVGEGIGEATRERGRLCLAGIGTDATTSFTTLGFDPERVLRLGVAFVPDFAAGSAEADTAGIAAGIASALVVRPKPRDLASDDRRSE